MPSKGSISGRTSSITAAFFQAITPVVIPTEKEVEEALEILGMTRGKCVCSYCGDTRTEWDHFRPIVIGREPTGFITEIANLVPSCGKCNQSKGNSHWRDWMLGQAKKSPKSRNIVDLNERVFSLERFESWRKPIKVEYASIFGKDQWDAYLALLSQSVEHLREAQITAKLLFGVASNAIDKSNHSALRE